MYNDIISLVKIEYVFAKDIKWLGVKPSMM